MPSRRGRSRRLTFAEKRDVARDIFQMLDNDIHRVIESICHQHSTGGHGPNFTAVLTCMVAPEVLGRFSNPRKIGDTASAVRQLRKLRLVDGRYARYPTTRWHIFRNGIAHLFIPKQLATERVAGRVEWPLVGQGRGACVDFLGSPQGAADLAQLRNRHLGDQRSASGELQLVVIPHVLYLDVRQAIDAFVLRLNAPSNVLRKTFSSGFNVWWKSVGTSQGTAIPARELAQLKRIV